MLHFSDQEVCNVYRSRGNTTAACKHVTSYFLFSSFLIILLFFFSFRSLCIQKEPQLVFAAAPGY